MSLYEYATRVWKERPPGPEQMLLEEMFEDGSIDPHATAESVRLSKEMFQNFTPKNFAAHFRKTKARVGDFVSTRTRQMRGAPKVATAKTAASGYSHIQELGSSDSSVSLIQHSVKSSEETLMEIKNPQFKTWTYTDHQLKNDYVCMAVTIFSGSKTVSFDLTEDGMQVIVTFSWPGAIHNAAELFHHAIRSKTISMQHPMIHAFASYMLKSGITEKSLPEGKYIIPLPCKVRREVGSYTIEKIQQDDANILFVKFTAYQDDLIIKQDNRTISF